MASSREPAVRAQVAIIGYGPVGVTAANFLGRMGVSTVVIERDADVFSRARAISTDEEVVRIWQQLGLAEQLKADMLSDRPIEFLGVDGQQILGLKPRSRGNGHPTQLFIYQPALERTLRASVAELSDVTVLLEHECVDLEQNDDGVSLRVRRIADEANVTVHADYVIAADGGSSRTRAGLGVGFDGRTYEDRWVVIDTKVLTPWPEVDRLRFHCNATRPAVDCPTPLDHHRWEFPVLPADDESELVTEESVRALIANQGVDPANIEILRTTIYNHHVRFASRWRVGRVFLAGDAAHAMPPWIGEGMAAGVRDVANLCWKIAGVLAGELPDRVLDTYEVERKPHVRAMTAAAVAFGRIITERRRMLTSLRDPLLRAAMKVPPIREFVWGGSWFPDSRSTSGFLASRPRNKRDAVGWQLPQPRVAAPNADDVLLDDALPAGWVVLHLAGVEESPDLKAWRSAGVPIVAVLSAGAEPTSGAVVDTTDALAGWLTTHRAAVVALRPDRYIFAAAPQGRPLAAPPHTLVREEALR